MNRACWEEVTLIEKTLYEREATESTLSEFGADDLTFDAAFA